MKINNLVLIFSFLLLSLSACQEQEPTTQVMEPKKRTLKILLSKSDLSLEEGRMAKFRILRGRRPYNISGADKNIADVSLDNGLITVNALSKGKTTLSILAADGATEQIEINVTEKEPLVLLPLVDEDAVVLVKGKSTSFPLVGGDFPFTPSGYDETVAEVEVKRDIFGDVVVNVNGLKEGATVLTVVDNKDIEYTFNIHVFSTDSEAFLAYPKQRTISENGTLRVFNKHYVSFGDVEGGGVFGHSADHNLSKVGASFLNYFDQASSVYLAWEGDFSVGKKTNPRYHYGLIEDASEAILSLEILRVEGNLIWVVAEKENSNNDEISFIRMVAKIPQGA